MAWFCCSYLLLFIVLMAEMVYGNIPPKLELSLHRGTPSRQRPNVDCETILKCSGHHPGYHNESFDASDRRLFTKGASCQCDGLCDFYNDCCIDGRENKINGIPSQVQHLMECFHMRDYGEAIYMVRGCPPWPMYASIHHKCTEYITNSDLNPQNIIQRVPVSHIRTGLVFNNVYCAICNGIDVEKEILFWKADLILKEKEGGFVREIGEGRVGKNQSLSEKADAKNIEPQMLSVIFPGAVAKPRQCLSNKVNQCPDDFQDEDITQLCANHSGIAYPNEMLGYYQEYRNKYCAFCNGVSESNLSCVPFNRMGYEDSISRQHSESFSPYKVLLDFNSGSGYMSIYGSQTKQEKAIECDKGYKYEPFSGSCMFLYCPPKMALFNDSCQPIFANYLSKGNKTDYCPTIRINESDFTLLDNGNVYLNQSGGYVNQTKFYISRDHSFITMCFDDYQNQNIPGKVWTNTGSKVQEILTLIGLIFSLIGLLLLIVVYSVFKKLQNTPGKGLLALSVSLFIAQLLFLVSSPLSATRGLCVFISVIMHFSFLCSFSWMNVLAFDIWRTFNKEYQLVTQDHRNKKFIKYAVYAFGVPTVIVCICLGLNFSGPNVDPIYKPHYGVEVCWIRNKYFLIASFAAPLVLVIISNFIFFSMAVYYIHQATRSTHVVQDKGTGRRRLLLYLKLSTIVGLTWLFGFIANFVKSSSVFWYLFTIFNTLQGLFLFFGFVCTRTVFRMIKDKSVLSTIKSSTVNSKKTTSSSI